MTSLGWIQSPAGLAHGLMVLGADALARWNQLSDQRRLAIWRAGAAVSLVVLGLLAAFHHVVSGVVEQAALQRKLLAHQASETLRCKALRGGAEREQCLWQLRAQQAPVQARGQPVQAVHQAQAAINQPIQ